ncbi:MAG: DUF4252 domain-containing protein [Bacteroidota bacterium]
MKKVIATLLSICFVFSLYGQNFNSFFDKLEDSDDYAVVTVNKEMFRMLASFSADLDDKGIRELVRNIDMLKIYINEDNGTFEDFKEIKTMATGTSLTNLISVKSANERVELFTNPVGDEGVVDGLLLLVHEGDQNVFIKMDGRINLDDLARLTESMDIDGFDQLKKIGGGM